LLFRTFQDCHRTPLVGSATVVVRTAAPPLGLNLQSLEARDPNEFERVFDAMTREHADGLLVLSDTFATFYRARLAELAAKHRLPAIYGHNNIPRRAA
jgi:hypothetical protein